MPTDPHDATTWNIACHTIHKDTGVINNVGRKSTVDRTWPCPPSSPGVAMADSSLVWIVTGSIGQGYGLS